MPRLLDPAEGFARLEKELQSEKAAALARIAATLDDACRALARLAPADEGGAEAESRYRARHEELRQRALRYRWYLEVQREAVGISRHDGLDELYPIPDPLPGSETTNVLPPPSRG